MRKKNMMETYQWGEFKLRRGQNILAKPHPGKIWFVSEMGKAGISKSCFGIDWNCLLNIGAKITYDWECMKWASNTSIKPGKCKLTSIWYLKVIIYRSGIKMYVHCTVYDGD